MENKSKLFDDVYRGLIPSRIPINVNLSFETVAEFHGTNLKEAQWKPEIMEAAGEKICETLFSDICPMAMNGRMPAMYQFLNSQSFVLGSNGFMQHPEVVGMYDEDYDYLIESPIDCLIERVIPRQFKSLSEPSMLAAISLAQGIQSLSEDMGKQAILLSKLNNKYGYFSAPPNSGKSTEAAFDYLADQLRSFSGISKDIRRKRDLLPDACEALYEIAFLRGLPLNISESGQVFLPLHMPPFMREKDFADLWWPSFVKMIHHYAALGVHCKLFCEQDWTRYLDYLLELPTNTILWFEYGDPKTIKDKLGHKFIICGLYPLVSLKTKTKQECIDTAKEYIDILAPNGKYIFCFDKIPIGLSDVNMDNLCALTEFIRDYGTYTNAGEQSGEQFNQSDYKIPQYRKIESKYFPSWKTYQTNHPNVSDYAKDKYVSLNNSLYQFMMSLIY